FEEAKDNARSAYADMRDNVRLTVAWGQNNDMSQYQSRLDQIIGMDLNLGSLFDDALNVVKGSDAVVASFRNALNYDPSQASAARRCDAYNTPDDVTNAVNGASGELDDTATDVGSVQSVFQARADQLTKIANDDQSILQKGPAIVAGFQKLGKTAQAQQAQTLIDRAKGRQDQLPRELAAAQQGLQAASAARSAIGSGKAGFASPR